MSIDTSHYTESDFESALKAFEFFTVEDKRQALEAFAGLKYPRVEDRFFEAVHRQILRIQEGRR